MEVFGHFLHPIHQKPPLLLYAKQAQYGVPHKTYNPHADEKLLFLKINGLDISLLHYRESRY
jgi:hypothetical protein